MKEKLKQRLEEVLDEQFPKGECKERGHALVLFAEAVSCLDIQQEKFYLNKQPKAVAKLMKLAKESGVKQTLKDELEFLKSLMNCLSHIQVDKFLTERIAQIEKELGEEE